MRDHILAIRASALQMIAHCDQALAAITPASEGPCAHPVELRTAAPRMGRAEAWICACGAEGDE